MELKNLIIVLIVKQIELQCCYEMLKFQDLNF